MKKWIALLLVCIFLLGAVPMVSAATAKATVTANKTTVTSGSTVTVTVTHTAGTNVAAFDATLTYDASVLEFVSISGANNGGSAGVLKISYFATAKPTAKSHSFTVTFKAKATGSSKVSLSSTGISDWDLEPLGNASGSVTINVQNPSLSGNANLTALYVSSGSLSPAFSPNVTSYNIVIPYSTTVLTVSAETADKNAKITVEGSKDMQVGKNVRKVIVTAPNGTKKTYTLNITRQEGTGNETGTSQTPDTTTDVSKVTVGEDTLYIAKDLKDIALPVGFEQVMVTVNDTQFPSAQDKSLTVVLLYLVDENGENGKFYMYDTASMTFSDFNFVTVETGVYTFLTPDNSVTVPNGFTQTFVKVGEQTVAAWSFPDEVMKDYYLVYALSPAGTKGLYQYDTLEGTFQRYTASTAPTVSEDIENNVEDEKKGFFGTIKGWYNSLLNRFGMTRLILITVGAVLLIAALVVLIILLAKRPKDCKH